MIASRSAKLAMMNVSLRVLSISGEAWKPGAQMTVNSGTCFWYSSRLRGFTNIVRANRLCQAFSRDDADRQAVLGVGAGEAVLHEDVAALQEALQARPAAC